ncbi:transcription antitermination factor NusB [soil metagenome]
MTDENEADGWIEPQGDSKRARKDRKRPAPHTERRNARILAMKVLYESDLTDHNWLDVLERTLSEDEIPVATADYANRLATGVMTNKVDIDVHLREAAPAYPIRQLSPIDRNVLRLAIYELSFEPDVPTRAVINEAVEMAKRFGGDNSSRFVNGVIGTIATKFRSDGGEGRRKPKPGS